MTTWNGFTPMARIEVVIDGEHVPAVRDHLLASGATGFTAINGVAGFGHHGEHAGRLVVPCDHIEAESKRYLSHVIWSDDGGATWQLGGSSPQDKVNECEVVECSDGSLLLNMRNYDRAQHARQVCISDDGGHTFRDQRHDPTLIEPICQASIRRILWPDGDRPGLIAFSNPAHAKKRANLTLRLSRDDGATWFSSQVLYAGGAAYSCLIALPGADPATPEIGCLFEADGYRRIDLARVPAPSTQR